MNPAKQTVGRVITFFSFPWSGLRCSALTPTSQVSRPLSETIPWGRREGGRSKERLVSFNTSVVFSVGGKFTTQQPLRIRCRSNERKMLSPSTLLKGTIKNTQQALSWPYQAFLRADGERNFPLQSAIWRKKMPGQAEARA